MNWGKIVKYAAALFAAQFMIGFLEGSFSPTGADVPAPLLSTAASFALCGAIFTHLAAHQSFKPFAHAWVALLVQVAVASVLTQVLTGSLLGKASSLLLVLEWLVLVCALVAGTALGSTLRHIAGQPADA